MENIKQKLDEVYKQVKEKYNRRIITNIPRKNVQSLYNTTLKKLNEEEKKYKTNKTPYNVYHNKDAKKTKFHTIIKNTYEKFFKQVYPIINCEEINEEITQSIFQRVEGPLYRTPENDDELAEQLLNAY